jgi:hypothetical protein
MAVSRTISRKSASQNPVAFFKGKQSGGNTGNTGYTTPERIKGGPMREKIYGRKDLAK